VFWFPVKVGLGLLFVAPVALESAHEVVVLTGGADPASIWEVEIRRLLGA